ncbi:hypothetical protein AOLI_G00002400 [Acnodon oligacanthus]
MQTRTHTHTSSSTDEACLQDKQSRIGSVPLIIRVRRRAAVACATTITLTDRSPRSPHAARKICHSPGETARPQEREER